MAPLTTRHAPRSGFARRACGRSRWSADANAAAVKRTADLALLVLSKAAARPRRLHVSAAPSLRGSFCVDEDKRLAHPASRTAVSSCARWWPPILGVVACSTKVVLWTSRSGLTLPVHGAT